MTRGAEENHEELLKISIDELRKLYDGVRSSFDNLRAKALALLVAEIAVVTFLFSADNTDTFTSIKIVYGIVFLLIGMGCLVGSFGMFLWAISGVKNWEQPPETKELKTIEKNFDNSPIKLLKNLKDEYVRIIPECIRILGKRSDKFKLGVYLLSAGVFIILMLKYGGGTLNIVID